MLFFLASNPTFCVECVVVPLVIALILVFLLFIVVLLIALYWYKQRRDVRKRIHSQNSPAKLIQLVKVDEKTAEKDVENFYSNVQVKSNEDVITESVMKTDTD